MNLPLYECSVFPSLNLTSENTHVVMQCVVIPVTKQMEIHFVVKKSIILVGECLLFGSYLCT